MASISQPCSYTLSPLPPLTTTREAEVRVPGDKVDIFCLFYKNYANLDNRVCSWAKDMHRVGTVLSILQTGMRRRTKEEKANYNDIVKLSEK